MPPSSITVQDKFKNTGRSSREDSEAADDKILDVLTSLEEDLDSLSLAAEKQSGDRQQDSKLSRERLEALLHLYKADQSFADKVLPILESSKDEDADLPHLKNLPRSALREMLFDSTDDFTQSLGLVSRPGFGFFTGLRTIDSEADKLLQEFFLNCREPNMAEMEMLANACRVSIGVVSEWFKLKRDQTRRLFVMQGLATKGSKLGTRLRKREYELQRGCAKVPPEFNDPDLNEGWYEKP